MEQYTPCEEYGHNYVEGQCRDCGEAQPKLDFDPERYRRAVADALPGIRAQRRAIDKR